MAYTKKLTEERIKQIIGKGVINMPSNPASRGYSLQEIREFYYKPEEETLNVLSEIEGGVIKELDNLENQKADNESVEQALSEVENKLSQKVDKDQLATIDGKSLTGGGNIDIATINGHSLVGGGNIVIEGGSGGGSVEVDNELSTESENPVQNKVLTEKFNSKVGFEDYATSSKSGVVKQGEGLYMGSDGKININITTPSAKQDTLKTQMGNSSRQSVAIYSMPKLVKLALSYPDINTLYEGNLKASWTEEEKVLARQTIGATKLYKHTIQFSINWTSIASGSQYTGDFTVECLSTSNTKVEGINNNTWFNLPSDAVIVEGSGNVYEFHKNSATMSFYTIDNQEYKKQDWEIWRDKQDDWSINNNQGKTISLVFVASAVTPM